MNEKEIEKNFNDKLINYKKALYTEFIDIFGEEYAWIINDILNTPVVYHVERNGLNYYEEIYDTLNAEDQDIVDYFKEKLGDNDEYIVGSSLGIITDKMIENKSCACSLDTQKFVTAGIIFNPNLLYSSDEIYVSNLIQVFFHALKGASGPEVVCLTIAIEIVRRLRTKGFYLFDNKELLKEYSECFDEENSEYTDIIYGKKLLSPILSVLPLIFTNTSEFYRIVGRENFDDFCRAYDKKDTEECYYNIIRMKDSLLKNSTSTVVMLDIPTISRIIKSANDKKESKQFSISNPEPPVVRITPRPTHRRSNSILSEKIIKKDIYNYSNINDNFYNFKKTNDNFYNIKKEYDNYYIDEDGKDTLDPPSRLKR